MSIDVHDSSKKLISLIFKEDKICYILEKVSNKIWLKERAKRKS